jgi:hypothetical protein
MLPNQIRRYLAGKFNEIAETMYLNGVQKADADLLFQQGLGMAGERLRLSLAECSRRIGLSRRGMAKYRGLAREYSPGRAPAAIEFMNRVLELCATRPQTLDEIRARAESQGWQLGFEKRECRRLLKDFIGCGVLVVDDGRYFAKESPGNGHVWFPELSLEAEQRRRLAIARAAILADSPVPSSERFRTVLHLPVGSLAEAIGHASEVLAPALMNAVDVRLLKGETRRVFAMLIAAAPAHPPHANSLPLRQEQLELVQRAFLGGAIPRDERFTAVVYGSTSNLAGRMRAMEERVTSVLQRELGDFRCNDEETWMGVVVVAASVDGLPLHLTGET